MATANEINWLEAPPDVAASRHLNDVLARYAGERATPLMKAAIISTVRALNEEDMAAAREWMKEPPSLSPAHPAAGQLSEEEMAESGYDGPMIGWAAQPQAMQRAVAAERVRDDLETALAPADGKWAFDESVTAAFDDMLERSIPQYEVMRKAVTDLAARFVPHGTYQGGVIVDLGASRGEAIAPLVDRYGVHAAYHAVEVAEPMREALAARFAGREGVRVHDTDLRFGYPPVPPADVTLLVLTLMFTPIQSRQRILRRVWQNTKPGGALILVEKVLGETADLDQAFVDLYHGLKGENGYTAEAIERKRLALEGVQVPVTAAWNADLLKQAGFTEVDCCWRWMNFAAWVAVRA